MTSKEMLPILLVLALSNLHYAFGFSCYHCSAPNGTICKITQKQQLCPQTTSSVNQQCVTLSYTKEITTEQSKTMYIPSFKKFCSADNGMKCHEYCEVVGGKNCKASCCSSNLCNDAVRKEEIWKSSYSHGNTVNSSPIINKTEILLLISLGIFMTALYS